MKRLREILNKNFMILLLLTIFNYTFFGIIRYGVGKYAKYPFYLKSIKFAIGFIDLFFVFLLIYFILSLIQKKMADIILKIYFVISLILFIIDILLYNTFKLYISTSTIQILTESNPREMEEFIGSYISFKNISIILLIFIGTYFLTKIKIHIHSKKLTYFLIVLMFLQVGVVKQNLKIFNETPFPRLINGSINVRENIRICDELSKNLNNDIKILKNESNIKDIVFIIGESTTRNHMSIYGYEKETNPKLAQLVRGGDMYVFDDVISPHGHTIASLKKVLTFHNYESNKNWHEYNILIDIMKKAGYKTYWFSNQEAFGFTISTLAKKSDVVLFNNKVNSVDADTLERYDEEIVEKSKGKIDDKNKNFIIYHLMGSHENYMLRYPKEFDKFHKDDYKNLNLSSKFKKEMSKYDNAVLYNDYVINKIIDLYKNKDAIIVYFSDHAEELFERGDFYGHGEGNLSRYTVEIPFIIYVSNEFKKLHPEIVERIKASQNNPYMTDDFIHTLLDIASIETPNYDKTRSVINEEYNSKRQRILKGLSYDEYYIKE